MIGRDDLIEDFDHLNLSQGESSQAMQLNFNQGAADTPGAFELSPIKDGEGADASALLMDGNDEGPVVDLVFKPAEAAQTPVDVPRQVQKLVHDQLATLKEQQRPLLTDLQNAQVQQFLQGLQSE